MTADARRPGARDPAPPSPCPQYRHGIYPHSPEQRAAAEAAVSALQSRAPPGLRVQTEVQDAAVFWPAEEVHQQYLEKGGGYSRPQSAEKGCADKIRCYG